MYRPALWVLGLLSTAFAGSAPADRPKPAATPPTAVAVAAPSGAWEPVTLTGSVVPLPEALRAFGLAPDPDDVASQVVLRTGTGELVPLLADEASRALFRDGRLRQRRAEIKGRRRAGLPYLQVTSFKVEEDGAMRTPEYYCEICAISVRSDQDCPCCQGPLELRMRPEAL